MATTKNCNRFPEGSEQRALCELRLKMRSDPLYHAIKKAKPNIDLAPTADFMKPRGGTDRGFYSAAAEWARTRGIKVNPMTGTLVSPLGSVGRFSYREDESTKEEPRKIFQPREGYPLGAINKKIEQEEEQEKWKERREKAWQEQEAQKEKGEMESFVRGLSEKKANELKMQEEAKAKAEKEKWAERREQAWQEREQEKEIKAREKQEQDVIKKWQDIVEPQIKERQKEKALEEKDYSETKGYRDLDRFYRGTPMGEAIGRASTGNTPHQFKTELRNRLIRTDGTIDPRFIPPGLEDNLEAQDDFMKMLELSITEERLLREYFGM